MFYVRRRRKSLQDFGWGWDDEKRPLGKPRRIRADNIKIGLKEMGDPDWYMWHL